MKGKTMKLEITIKTSYLPEWGAYEGVRELLQNGQDARTEFGATFEVRYRADTKTLVIENEGCTLPHEALLLGHTTKQDRSSLIGKFGEGLKLGVLALIRAGHSVKIRSGSEVWVPSIQRSEKFDADVLCFNIDKGRATKDRVQIEVGGIEPDAWESMKDCFLFLLSPKALAEVEVKTTSGSLLLGEKYAGRVYVKGIFVQRDVSLRYSYDFPDAEIDRDRKMLTKWDLNYRCQSIWKEALNKRPDLVEPFTQMLDQQSPDLDGLDDWSAKYLPDAVKAEVVRVFQDRHGADALPVTGLSESREVEHLGRKGVVTPKPLKAVLEAVLGTVEQVKANLRNETTTVYSWGDLSDVEKLNLETGISLIAKVRSGVSLDSVDVVDFRDENILGLYKDNRVFVAKKELAVRRDALRVLVHEFGHKISRETDGAKGHTDEVEILWADITEYLLTQQSN
jgi:hypothetical protein